MFTLIQVVLINACVLNSQLVYNKNSTILVYVVDSDLDIVVITATWLYGHESDQRRIAKLAPQGYTFHSVP